MSLTDRFTPKTDNTKRFQFGWHWGQPQDVYYWLLDTKKDEVIFSIHEEKLPDFMRKKLYELTDYMNGLIE